MADTIGDFYIANFPLPTGDPVQEALQAGAADPLYRRYKYASYDLLLGQLMVEERKLEQFTGMLASEGRPGERLDVTPAERAHLLALIAAHSKRLLEVVAAIGSHVPQDGDYPTQRGAFRQRCNAD